MTKRMRRLMAVARLDQRMPAVGTSVSRMVKAEVEMSELIKVGLERECVSRERRGKTAQW